MGQESRRHLGQDIAILAASVGVAVILAQTELVATLVGQASIAGPLESFIAGIFFTSAFTTAPAIVVLGKLAQSGSLATVTICGALGAMFGDFIIFKFIKDRLSEDLRALLRTETSKRLKHIARSRLFRWFSPLVAALVIASPLPDEVAIAILGLTGTRSSVFLPFSFMANALGILLVGLVGRSL